RACVVRRRRGRLAKLSIARAVVGVVERGSAGDRTTARRDRLLRVLGEPRLSAELPHDERGELLVVRAARRGIPHELLVVDDALVRSDYLLAHHLDGRRRRRRVERRRACSAIGGAGPAVRCGRRLVRRAQAAAAAFAAVAATAAVSAGAVVAAAAAAREPAE